MLETTRTCINKEVLLHVYIHVCRPNPVFWSSYYFAKQGKHTCTGSLGVIGENHDVEKFKIIHILPRQTYVDFPLS